MAGLGDLAGLAEQMNSIYINAYYQAVPAVLWACWRKDATRDQLEHMFDSLLDFCDDENFVSAFRFLAATYYGIYPKTVLEYIRIYREDWESDWSEHDSTVT